MFFCNYFFSFSFLTTVIHPKYKDLLFIKSNNSIAINYLGIVTVTVLLPIYEEKASLSALAASSPIIS